MNPVSRWIVRIYEPVLRWALAHVDEVRRLSLAPVMTAYDWSAMAPRYDALLEASRDGWGADIPDCCAIHEGAGRRWIRGWSRPAKLAPPQPVGLDDEGLRIGIGDDLGEPSDRQVVGVGHHRGREQIEKTVDDGAERFVGVAEGVVEPLRRLERNPGGAAGGDCSGHRHRFGDRGSIETAAADLEADAILFADGAGGVADRRGPVYETIIVDEHLSLMAPGL